MPRPAPYLLRWSSAIQRYELCEGRDQTILDLELDSSAWFVWLEQVPSFAFHGRTGSFTAHQEHKERGGGYWYAYLREQGKVTKRYLGRSADLTLTCLEQAAKLLLEQQKDTLVFKKRVEEHQAAQTIPKTSTSATTVPGREVVL